MASPPFRHTKGMSQNTQAQNSAMLAGSTTLSLALGTRSAFGLLLVPLAGVGVPIETVALAIALHNLAWGVVQPLAGAWADRHGATAAQVAGGLLYALGYALPAIWPHSMPEKRGDRGSPSTRSRWPSAAGPTPTNVASPSGP